MGPLQQRHQPLVALPGHVDMFVALIPDRGDAQSPLPRRLAFPQFQGTLQRRMQRRMGRSVAGASNSSAIGDVTADSPTYQYTGDETLMRPPILVSNSIDPRPTAHVFAYCRAQRPYKE